MDGDQVLALDELFGRHRLRVWIAGGWAVDALCGRQTRSHRDQDLAVDADQLDQMMSVLLADGFVVTQDQLPSRAEPTSAEDERVVDLHPVTFAADGSGRQAGLGAETFDYAANGFTTGLVEGTVVRCLSADQQRAFRVGYPLRPVDHHDLGLLDAMSTRVSDRVHRTPLR